MVFFIFFYFRLTSLKVPLVSLTNRLHDEKYKFFVIGSVVEIWLISNRTIFSIFSYYKIVCTINKSLKLLTTTSNSLHSQQFTQFHRSSQTGFVLFRHVRQREQNKIEQYELTFNLFVYLFKSFSYTCTNIFKHMLASDYMLHLSLLDKNDSCCDLQLSYHSINILNNLIKGTYQQLYCTVEIKQ